MHGFIQQKRNRNILPGALIFLLIFWVAKKTSENTPSSPINHDSGQIIATSHDLTPNGGSVREIPLFQGNLGSPWPECFPVVGLS